MFAFTGVALEGELLAQCRMASARGDDFPTIWRDVLRIHPLVDGAAIRVTDDEGEWLEVPLKTGQRLVYHDKGGFSIFSRVAIILRDRRKRLTTIDSLPSAPFRTPPAAPADADQLRRNNNVVALHRHKSEQ